MRYRRVVGVSVLSGLLLVAAASSDPLPSERFAGPTPVAELSPPGLRHQELLRIDRDFGQDHWELAVDGWIDDAGSRLHDLHLWWVNTDENDSRKPFGPHLRRAVEFDYTRGGELDLTARLAGDRKEYTFAVEVDASGQPVVYARVRLENGTLIARCRLAHGHLEARRFLGIPIGVARLTVACTDRKGRPQRGEVPDRRVAKGVAYEPD
jgi:hypothetical protein